MTQRSMEDKISEIKSRITLLDGDRKAYYENAEFTMKSNREHIAKLRKELKQKRKDLADCLAADEHVINNAFQGRPVARASMKNKSGIQAIERTDHLKSDLTKRLSALRDINAKKMKKIEQLKTKYNQMLKDASDAVAMDAGESKEAQELRTLENSLDKALLKCDEAEHIKKTYVQIKKQMDDESLTYGNKLNEIEAEIRKCKEELKQLKSMQNDAVISKDAAQQELSRHEMIVYSDRKKREIELQQMKKEAEEKKLQHERIEKRNAQRGSISQDELTPAEKAQLSGEDQLAKISTYEDAFRLIKDATGVSDTKEVVTRFENQGETARHLEELKKDGEKTITRLEEDKRKLQEEFERMKYSGEAKLSSGQRILEEFEGHLATEQARCDDSQDKLDRASKILVNVKAGVEHLHEKLHHLKANKGHVPTAQISQTSDEYVLDLLSISEEKLLKLLEELDTKDLNEVQKQMEEEEFHSNIEGSLPQYNTRVKLPQVHKDNVYDDEDDSGDDEGDIVTRNQIKRQAQNLIDSKTKRRVAKKKKKGGK